MSARAVSTQHHVAKIADVWGGQHAAYHRFPEPCAPATQACSQLVEENRRMKSEMLRLMAMQQGPRRTGEFKLGKINPLGSRMPREFFPPDFVKPEEMVEMAPAPPVMPEPTELKPEEAFLPVIAGPPVMRVPAQDPNVVLAPEAKSFPEYLENGVVAPKAESFPEYLENGTGVFVAPKAQSFPEFLAPPPK